MLKSMLMKLRIDTVTDEYILRRNLILVFVAFLSGHGSDLFT